MLEGRWSGKWWSGGRGSGGQVVGEVVVKCGGRVFVENALWWGIFWQKMLRTIAAEVRCCKGKGYAEIALLD